MSSTTTRPRPGPQPRRRSAAPAPRHRAAGRPEPTYVTRGGAVAIEVAPERTPAVRTRPARPSARPDLKVVRPDQRRRRRGITPAFALLLTVGVFGVLLAVAIAHTLLVNGQVHLDQVNEQVSVEQARYQELRQQVAALESPDRIVEAAKGQGMVSPPDLVYLQPSEAELPTHDGAPSSTPEETAAEEGEWSTVKPLLGAATP